MHSYTGSNDDDDDDDDDDNNDDDINDNNNKVRVHGYFSSQLSLVVTPY